LRTVFAEVRGRLAQVVAPFAGFVLPVEDLTRVDEAEREGEARRRAHDEGVRPYDLAAGPLFRARLLRLGAEDHVLVLALHHIVTDGWSSGILLGELSALYGAYRDGRESPLPELPVQYADYAVWQREQLQGPVLERQLAYWTGQLAGAPALLELPTDHPRPAEQSHRGARERFQLPESLVERLTALGQREGATLFMVLLGAFQVILARYSGSEDVVIGSPIAGRTRREVEGLIGFFVNTLVLRGDLSGDPTFREILRRARETTLGAYEHQALPFEKLVAELRPERSLGFSPLFQVMFTFNDVSAGGERLPGVEVRGMDGEVQTSRFDLTLGVIAASGRVGGVLEYSTDLFQAGTVRRILDHLQRVLEQVADDADVRLSHLELASADEQRRVLEAWNAPAGGAEHASARGDGAGLPAAAGEGAGVGVADVDEMSEEELDRLLAHLSADGEPGS
ncbi:MAG TPA: condensation domain-containing protein, partial [Longimicrobium sp.]|nr:condensation domain-containing protein [Longimicrobium sp.]